ncbi:MAG: hypothetical protein N3C12_12335 [Candidatus Binatia bacterium]|nr:hypothetical protein [Candidatus Binatia bacterium]
MAEHDERSTPATQIEDVILLQSTVEALRQERDQLLRRLHAVESSARERVQLVESRYREAASQVDALKRAAQQIREQLEEELARAQAHLRDTHHSAQQWQAMAESLRQRATEIESALESAHSRIADLETENAVLQGEVERLQAVIRELEADFEALRTALSQAEQEKALSARNAENLRDALRQLSEQYAAVEQRLQEALALVAEKALQNERLASAFEQAQRRIDELTAETVQLRSERDGLRREHMAARAAWEQELANKSAEWTQVRDALAQALEEAQNRNTSLEQESGNLRAQLCSLQMRSQLEAEELLRLEEELQAARAELQRERTIFEELAQQREADWQKKLQDLQQAFARYQEESQDTVATLQRELAESRATADAARAALTQLRQELEAAVSARASLEEKAARLVEDTTSLQAALHQRDVACAAAEARIEQLEGEIGRLRALFDDRNRALAEHRAELERAHQRLADLTDAWAKEREELTTSLDDLQLHGDQLEAELQQACWQLEELDARLQKATVEYYATTLSLAHARAEWARWELGYRLQARSHEALELRHLTESETSRAHLRQLASLLREADVERVELRHQQAALQQALEAKAHQEAELRRHLFSLQQHHSSIQQELGQLQEALRTSESRAAALAQELEQQSTAASQRTAEYEQRIRAREQELLALREERDLLQHEVEKLRAALTELEHATTYAAQRQNEELAALEAQVEEWKRRSCASEQAVAELRETLRAYEEEIYKRDEAVAAWQLRHRELQDEVAALSLRYEAQATAYQRLLTDFEQAQQHLAALQEQSVAILQAQELLTQENETLREQIQRAESERLQLAQVYERAIRERDDAVARWQASEAQRQKEQANYLSIRQQLDAERETLRTALDAARAQQAQLQAQITLLQRERGGRSGLPSADVVELERERAELKTQVEKLSAVIRQLGQEREEQRVAALQTQAALTARIDEIAAERGALTLRVAELETLVSQLDRECERLRKERLSPEEVRKYKAEVGRLEARVEELERLRAEAAQNHSAVVAGYLLELNQRTEALQAKEAELQELQRQVEGFRATIEELESRLEAEREERTQLEAALDELRRAAAGGTLRSVGTAASKPSPTAKASQEDVTTTPLRLADSGQAVFSSASAVTSLTSTGGGQAPLARLRESTGLTVVHLEESKECREQVQRLLKQIPHLRYLNTLDLADTAKDSPILLAVNLLNRAHDPIAALTKIVRQPGDYGIFAYCSEGKFGFLFGDATFFPSPFDVNACTAWLMSTYGSVQRLLVASNNIEMTSELRTHLAKVRCSASVALDFRQVIELIPLIQPEVVLVDLSLPRADGLRLISRLRNDEKTSGLPLGVILPDHQRVAELRHNAARAAREGSLSVDTLVKVLAQELGLPPLVHQSDTRSTAQPGSR